MKPDIFLLIDDYIPYLLLLLIGLLIHDFLYRIRSYDNIGTAPCQICGEQGHVERDCPRAEAMGFGRWENGQVKY